MTLDDVIKRIRRPATAVLAALALLQAPACDARRPSQHHAQRGHSTTAVPYTGKGFAGLGVPDVGYQSIVPDHGFKGVELADKESVIGRIQRTERWRNIIEAVENKYQIPRGIIYAVVMQESYGDPLQPNAKDDGGLGLVHFQPDTARKYGMHIFGDSHGAGADHRNGRQIRELFADCHYDIPCILKGDDRAQPIKNLDAIGRYIMDGYARKKTWQGAVGTINPGQRSYAGKVLKWKELIEPQLSAAARDFDERNRGKRDGKGDLMTFKHYTECFKDMSRNFGLDDYVRMRR